jgi:sporulation protein YlmC with PRC-barrel domain
MPKKASTAPSRRHWSTIRKRISDQPLTGCVEARAIRAKGRSMSQSMKPLYGHKLGASDGEIGHVKDFYFDDQDGAVRYLVVDTGTWLPGRQVLISPHAFGRLHQAGKLLSVSLTRKQIENSPSIESHKPAPRQYEEEYYRYFGWPFYWRGDAVRGDANLRSTQTVNGYRIEASDGTIGHVCDLMMDDTNWAIGQLIIKTGHWLSGREVQIPTNKVDRISYEESTVFVNLSREAIAQSPTHHP